MAAEGVIDGAAYIGREFEMDPGDHDWAECSIVVAKGFSIRHEGQGKLVAEAGRIVRILENKDIGAIKAWLHDMATPSDSRFIYGYKSTRLANVHNFVRGCDREADRIEHDQTNGKES